MEKLKYGEVQLRTGHDCPEVEQRYSYTLSLTSALDGSGDQNDATVTLTQGRRQGTRCIGGWLGHRASMDGCGKSRPQLNPILGTSRP